MHSHSMNIKILGLWIFIFSISVKIVFYSFAFYCHIVVKIHRIFWFSPILDLKHLMLNPSAWSKTFWAHSIYFECIQIFLNMFKQANLYSKISHLITVINIWAHSKYIERAQYFFDQADGLSIYGYMVIIALKTDNTQ